MNDINTVIFSGHLTRDVESRSVGENNVAKFSLAVNRKFGDREETSFIDVETWAKQADFASKYLKKGSGVVVNGRLKQDTWTDKETNSKRSKLLVVADRVEFLPSSGPRKEEVATDKPTPESTEQSLPF